MPSGEPISGSRFERGVSPYEVEGQYKLRNVGWSMNDVGGMQALSHASEERLLKSRSPFVCARGTTVETVTGFARNSMLGRSVTVYRRI